MLSYQLEVQSNHLPGMSITALSRVLQNDRVLNPDREQLIDRLDNERLF